MEYNLLEVKCNAVDQCYRAGLDIGPCSRQWVQSVYLRNVIEKLQHRPCLTLNVNVMLPVLIPLSYEMLSPSVLPDCRILLGIGWESVDNEIPKVCEEHMAQLGTIQARQSMCAVLNHELVNY